MRTAMSTLKGIVEDNVSPSAELSRGLGMEFKDFEVAVEVASQRPDDYEIRPDITSYMEKIIVGTENLMDSESIPNSIKSRIVANCKNLRDLLYDLKQEFFQLLEEP